MSVTKQKRQAKRSTRNVYVIHAGYFDYDTLKLTRVRFYVRGYEAARNFHPPKFLKGSKAIIDFWSTPKKSIRPPVFPSSEPFKMEVLS